MGLSDWTTGNFSTVTRGKCLGEAICVFSPCWRIVTSMSTGGGGGGVGDLGMPGASSSGGGEELSWSMAFSTASDTCDSSPPVSDSMLESNSWGVAVPVSGWVGTAVATSPFLITLLDRGTSSSSTSSTSSGGVAALVLAVGKYKVSVGAARKPIYLSIDIYI